MRVLLGLGGNQGNVAEAFAAALAALAKRFPLGECSSLWRSAALGPPQPDYLNAAVLLHVDVHPLRLLAFCHHLEARAGRDRQREIHHGPRPLDLDLLLAESVVVEGPALTLPHPRLGERRFALLPAVEVAPTWRHPRLHATLEELARQLEATPQRCERLGPLPAPPTAATPRNLEQPPRR